MTCQDTANAALSAALDLAYVALRSMGELARSAGGLGEIIGDWMIAKANGDVYRPGRPALERPAISVSEKERQKEAACSSKARPATQVFSLTSVQLP